MRYGISQPAMFTVQQVLHHPGKQSLLAPVDTVCGAGAPTALRAEALTVPRARASLELALPEFPRLARSSIPAWARAPRHLPTPGNSRGFRLAPAVNPQLRHAVRHLGHGPPPAPLLQTAPSTRPAFNLPTFPTFPPFPSFNLPISPTFCRLAASSSLPRNVQLLRSQHPTTPLNHTVLPGQSPRVCLAERAPESLFLSSRMIPCLPVGSAIAAACSRSSSEPPGPEIARLSRDRPVSSVCPAVAHYITQVQRDEQPGFTQTILTYLIS